ncbi:TlpA disulfide reductase family protein [Marivirga harenae]|uniref:TlpA family protein disulfide reductase n=1 Tax=Marivirga harenae TaxID=2010992 RepID=UPI0026E09E18|nr:TlpA disulfide reductase family protein [Marivirga harenae]WKV10750.1 TlpA disulfide reductase family protein [Marivirga harenae]|tara:strand:+ start:5254 stop:5736 length:483 start_codon:yes stop_codon:yes gene_type:complete
MSKIGLILLIIGFFSTNHANAQNSDIKIIKVPELEDIMNQSDADKLLVINFWATWCKPCVKELPYFVNAQKQFSDVEFVYMSIDFSENATKAEKFAQKKGLNPDGLYLIDDLDYNSWIDKVSPEWSGAIPATLIIKDGQKYFYEKEFHEGELENLIKQKL